MMCMAGGRPGCAANHLELCRTSLRERMSFAAASVGSGLGPDPDSSFEMALQEAIAA